MDYEKQYHEYLARVNRALEAACNAYLPEESEVCRAARYSLMSGGKRIRAVLVLSVCDMLHGNAEAAEQFAAAVEMLHCYSLIHDDLPCMDNDDMRRGKPSNHKVYGYANALLAGDGLLTLAFETVLGAKELSAEKRAAAGCLLAEAAGCSGMIAGQVMDLANEERSATADDLAATDRLKTGELIRCACQLGCIAAGADDKKLEAARVYAENLGIAFQIVDDILDVTSDEATLGKPIGSDAENCKNTYVSLLGLEEAQRIAAELTDKAIDALKVFADEAEFLISLSEKLLSRNK